MEIKLHNFLFLETCDCGNGMMEILAPAQLSFKRFFNISLCKTNVSVTKPTYVHSRMTSVMFYV